MSVDFYIIQGQLPVLFYISFALYSILYQLKCKLVFNHTIQ